MQSTGTSLGPGTILPGQGLDWDRLICLNNLSLPSPSLSLMFRESRSSISWILLARHTRIIAVRAAILRNSHHHHHCQHRQVSADRLSRGWLVLGIPDLDLVRLTSSSPDSSLSQCHLYWTPWCSPLSNPNMRQFTLITSITVTFSAVEIFSSKSASKFLV